MKSFLRKKPHGLGQRPCPEPTHPLPWRNLPSDGLNHVADANGRPVYDGSDAAEMFRLYSAEAQAAVPDRATRPRERRTASHEQAGRGTMEGRQL